MYETAQAFDYEQLVFSQHQSTLVLGAVNRLLRSLQRLESSDLSLDYSMPRGTKRRRGATDDIQYQDTPEEMQARIASTIREKRALIDQSNKEEYVKRAQLLNLSGETCARTDAVKINRRAQMKYDVVHDEDGPLARSTFDQSDTSQRNADPSIQRSRRAGDTKAARGQVLGMRCETIEDHLNVQYGMSGYGLSMIVLLCSAESTHGSISTLRLHRKSHNAARKGASTMGSGAL